MGHCYAMIGQDHKALASYEQALKHVPNSQVSVWNYSE